MRAKLAGLWAALMICSTLQAQIEGAFGKRFGDKLDAGLTDVMDVQTGAPDRSLRTATFRPAAPIVNFDQYEAYVTPKSHRIFLLGALGKFPNEAAVAELIKMLESKHGPFKWTKSDGSEVSSGERVLGDCEIKLVVADRVHATLTYRNLTLEAAAKAEGETGKPPAHRKKR